MKRVFNYFNNLKFSYKANFLIFIIAGGMFTIIILSQLSIFILKNKFYSGVKRQSVNFVPDFLNRCINFLLCETFFFQIYLMEYI